MLVFERPNGKRPASEFLDGLTIPFQKKFHGSFDAFTKMGKDYRNSERFKALKRSGKPLWEFKEFDHRLYCTRQVTEARVEVVLLHGWIKEKKGRTMREGREIEIAKRLLNELLKESSDRNR